MRGLRMGNPDGGTQTDQRINHQSFWYTINHVTSISIYAVYACLKTKNWQQDGR